MLSEGRWYRMKMTRFGDLVLMWHVYEDEHIYPPLATLQLGIDTDRNWDNISAIMSEAYNDLIGQET